MNIRRFFKSIFEIGISNLITLFSNVVLSLLIPKVLGVEDYGLYKIFTLYIGYVSLLHFGFVDGVVLKFGGRNYNDLNKSEMQNYFSFFFITEIIVSLLVLITGVLVISKQYRFILICVVVNIVLVNLTSYFQLLSQAVKRFKELATRNIVNAILQCCFVGTLFASYCLLGHDSVNYKTCIVLNLIVKLVLLIWYIATYKELIAIRPKSFTSYKGKSLEIFKLGLPITWAAMIANFVILLDRQFVSVFFDTKTYAYYAFAYTLFGLIISMIQSVATVLYPMLKENNDRRAICNAFPAYTMWILIITSLSLASFQVLCLIVEWILPQYVPSLSILNIIFPGILLSCSVSVITMSFYKYMDLGKQYFYFSLITLAIALATNVIAYTMFNSPEAIAIASIITLILQALITNAYFARKCNTVWLKNFVYSITIIIAFYVTSYFLKDIESLLMYFVSFLIITTLFYKKELHVVIQRFRNMKER